MSKTKPNKCRVHRSGLLLKVQGAIVKDKMICRRIPFIDNSRNYPMVDQKGTPEF
jgi:hypothetical protein